MLTPCTPCEPSGAAHGASTVRHIPAKDLGHGRSLAPSDVTLDIDSCGLNMLHAFPLMG